MDHLPYSILFSLIIPFWYFFWTSTYFCLFVLLSTNNLYFLLIYFHLQIIDSYELFCAGIKRNSVSRNKSNFLIISRSSIVSFHVLVAWNIHTVFFLLPIYVSYTYQFIFMVVWLFGFYGISTFVGYLMANPFLNK